MWETFIIIPTENTQLRYSDLYDIVRFKIQPLITRLIKNRVINWYCFLIHGKDTGVPTTQNDNNIYFHLRIALNSTDSKINEMLPEYCVLTRKIEQGIDDIAGIDKAIIKNEDIAEAWRIIGEQSEWFLHLLSVHKDDVPVPPQQIAQFLHYFANMTQIQFS
jgi:hypothetical protein